jgi:hypothetical protein
MSPILLTVKSWLTLAKGMSPVALYRDKDHVKQAKPHQCFETVHKPGAIADDSGIYRCVNCGDENAWNKGNPLPPQNKHQHRAHHLSAGSYWCCLNR